MTDDIEFTVKCKMKARWVPHFLHMLSYMQGLGEQGSSRSVGIFVDGDGDFRPTFEFDQKLIDKSVTYTDNGGNRIYDAG